MLRIIKISVLLVGLTVGTSQRANAFALAGPWEAWMSAAWGYPDAPQFGILSLGDEYRWNTPVITFGYDESFLQFFGSNGVAQVDACMKILNDLPPFSTMSQDLREFPLTALRPNYRAAALGLLDLKSQALGIILNELGLYGPENFVWAIRDDYHSNPGDIPLPTVIMRNFDPITLNPSPYVNGVLFTYHIFHNHDSPIQVDAVEDVVDPLAPGIIPGLTTVASGAGFTGTFVTGLTRDDVGGLRYLYRRSNLNIENPPPGVTNAGFFVPGVSTSGGTSSGWFPVDPVSLTNNAGGFPGGAGWWFWNPATNNAATNITGGGGLTGGTNWVSQALRPGVDKITFVRVDYDSLLDATISSSLTNQVYTDSYVANNTLQTQNLLRTITRPDIVFFAQDLGTVNGVPVGVRYNDSTVWVNNSNINGEQTGQGTQGGPGVIQGPINIGFTKLYPYWINQYPNFITEANARKGFTWASFDGSTNAPIVYPNGTDIRNLERQILGF